MDIAVPSNPLAPGRIAVFPLSGQVFLPRLDLPLNIFEERYRQLVRDSESQPSLMVAMVPTNPLVSGDKIVKAGAGKVEIVELHPDGTSFIVVRGKDVVELTDFRDDEKSYLTASFKVVPQTAELTEPDLAVLQRLQIYAGRTLPDSVMKKTDLDNLFKFAPSRAIDALIQSFIEEPSSRQVLLECQSLSQRILFFESMLMNSGLWKVSPKDKSEWN